MWILYSILAALAWSFTNIIDKVAISKVVKRPIVLTVLLGVIDLIIACIILSNNFVLLTLNIFLLSLLTGIFFLIGTVLYYTALKGEETSRIAPLFALNIIWTMVLAAIFLNEVFVIKEYVGIIIIFFGSALICIKRKVKIYIGKGFFLMIASTVFYSACSIFQKYLLDYNNFWIVFAYTSIGYFIALIPVSIYYIKDIKKTIKAMSIKDVGVISTINISDTIGSLLYLVALSFGFVTLAEAVSSVQYIFVFILSLLISIFIPRIIKEELKKSIVILKIIAIVLIIGGVVLIA